MGEPSKLTIYAFRDDKFEQDTKKSFTVQVNPSTISYRKGVQTTKEKSLGTQYDSPQYSKHNAVSFSFDTVLDSTGAIENRGDIPQQIKDLEAVVYDINGDIHSPNYLKVSWGSFIFKGVLTSLNYQFTLFAANGQPLRVKVSFTLSGYTDKLQAAKLVNTQSPDLSRIIVIKAGESIAHWCNEIYGDPSYCTDIAAYNSLPSFRNVKPGTQLMFPPLVR